MEASTASYVVALARLSLFADLSHPQLEALAHSFGEEVFAEGQRVIRQDVTGGGFYVILDGEAKIVIDGNELKAFLIKQPSVMYRMLQIEARRLRAANVWNS